VELALRAFNTVAADVERLNVYCAMSAAMDTAEDAGQEAAIGEYLQKLGPDFEKAWALADDLDEGSADARALEKAVDDLTGMCD
jgi:hypothetical protein